MSRDLFSSWLAAAEAEEDPAWRQRGLVIAVFAAGGVIGGALSALLPSVELHLSHSGWAGLSAALAALPLAGSLFRAGRRGDRLPLALLCLALTALGYLAFAVAVAVTDALSPSTFFWDGGPPPRWYDPGHLAIGLFVTWGVLVLTWKVYVPCALVTGWTPGLRQSHRSWGVRPAQRPSPRPSPTRPHARPGEGAPAQGNHKGRPYVSRTNPVGAGLVPALFRSPLSRVGVRAGGRGGQGVRVFGRGKAPTPRTLTEPWGGP